MASKRVDPIEFETAVSEAQAYLTRPLLRRFRDDEDGREVRAEGIETGIAD